MSDFADGLIAAHQAGLANRRAREKKEQDAEDRKFEMEKKKHELQAMKLADKAALREETIQNLNLNPFPVAPTVSTAAPQTTTMPIPQTLMTDRQFSDILSSGSTDDKHNAFFEFNRKSTPQASTLPDQATPLPLPQATIPGVQGPDTQVPVMSMQQHLIQLAEQQRKEQALKQADELFKASLTSHSTPEGGVTTFGIPGVTPTTSIKGPAKAKEPTGDFQQIYLPAYAMKLGKTVATMSPDEQMNAVKDYATRSQDPEMKDLTEAVKRGQLLQQKMLLDQQPTKDDVDFFADQVVNHRIAPSQIPAGMGAGGQMFRRNVQIAALKKDPTFNMEEAESAYALVKSPGFQNTVRYMDSVQESIPLVIDRARKLANGKVVSINALINAGKAQFNDVNLKKFNTDRILVADEIAKILQGGGTGSGTSDAKLAQAGEILKATDNPEALAGALADVNELIGYRKKSLTRGTYLEGKGAAAPAQPKTLTGPGGATLTLGPDGLYH